jgi:ribosomal protein S18 acetylase RimI-like enzyme
VTAVEVRRARVDELPALARLMGAAFQHDPVSSWLLPQEADRAERHPPFFRLALERVLAEGEIHTTATLNAVALWLPVDPALPEPPPPPGMADRLRSALGTAYDRFTELDKLMTGNHPERPHTYLPFIAVAPADQGHGIGSALLRHKLGTLTGPAYLEASSPTSVRLYERMGFHPVQPPIALPGGPNMYPMWRDPLDGPK